MPLTQIITLLIIGVVAGAFSGTLGIGGGLIMIPALIHFMKMNQHQAQGTTLAIMIPPITILATLVYYEKGYIDLPKAIYVFIGFFAGSFLGGLIAVNTPEYWLKKIFGVALLYAGYTYIIGK